MSNWPFIGESASLLAAMIWALSLSLYTRYGLGMSSMQLNLYKNSVALCLLLLTASLIGWQWPKDSESLGIIALSGLIGLALGDSLLFVAMKSIGVQRTSVLQCLAPPLAALLAWILFGEALMPSEWCGLILTVACLAGIIATRAPSAHGPLHLRGLLFALAAAFCQALAMISLRWSLQGVDVWMGTLTRILPSVFVLVLVLGSRSELKSLKTNLQTPRRALMLALAASLGTFLGLVLMSTGAKYAKAAVATALSSTTPIWILPFAHFMLKEALTPRVVFFTVGAVTGVILMIFAPML